MSDLAVVGAVLIALLVPGIALGISLGLRRSTAVFVGPALTFALVTVVASASSYVDLPWNAWSFVVYVVVACGLAVLARTGTAGMRPPRPAEPARSVRRRLRRRAVGPPALVAVPRRPGDRRRGARPDGRPRRRSWCELRVDEQREPGLGLRLPRERAAADLRHGQRRPGRAARHRRLGGAELLYPTRCMRSARSCGTSPAHRCSPC